ncbi:MAG TPA: hypothetical protein VHQ92_08415 [Pseudolabrys sp.]|jgi:hypothetical protein|nr:hypothetical protein [Pseudolabrys sp.]
MANEASRIVMACAMIAVSQFTLSAVAETLMHRAENQVPVAIVRVERTADHTEIHLQTQAALEKVCFAPTGLNSPYLLANGQNYRYLGGDNVTACPQRRDYAAGDVVVLRFAPLDAGSSTFSLTSGSQKQSADAVSPAAPSWNFIRVILN